MRQDLAHPRGRVHEPPEDLERRRGRLEPQAGEQLFGRRPIHARRGRRAPRERLEQRPVEESLVDPADALRLAFVLLRELGGADETERSRQRGARARIRGQIVGLQVAHDLEPMLQPPQEPVGVGERVGVRLRDVALLGQGRERSERVRLAQPRIATSVHDLQQLHRELHVADPAATALDLRELLPAATDVLLQPDLGPTDVVDRAGLQLLRVDERRHAVHERRADPRIARDRARLDHRLPLPGGRLALVVLERRLQPTRQ